jgi:Na+-translocating ferredoxin:NAD+ oxidoreductase RnfE subunit
MINAAYRKAEIQGVVDTIVDNILEGDDTNVAFFALGKIRGILGNLALNSSKNHQEILEGLNSLNSSLAEVME